MERRDFLTGGGGSGPGGDRSVDAVDAEGAAAPALEVRAPTARLGITAMACDFEVVLNPGPGLPWGAASAALELVEELEAQMSVYRDSELTRLNHTAWQSPQPVERQLFELLSRAGDFARRTEGAFDPTAGPLVALWRACRQEFRVPEAAEIAAALERVGIDHVTFDATAHTVHYDRPGVQLNLNAMGKGYALDRAADRLAEAGVSDWLMHGGHSSILCRGSLRGEDGWPIAIQNPLLPHLQLASLRVRDRAVSTSGTATQFFRIGGRRFGHILDPRTGWPVDEVLSATVLTDRAADAEVLSTAFCVFGVEKGLAACHNFQKASLLIVVRPATGRRLEVIAVRLDDSELAVDDEQCTLRRV